VLILVAALAGGLVAGHVLGGRLRNLDHLQLDLPWLIFLALGLQLVIFSPFGQPFSDTLTVALHLFSYALILAFAAANWREPGIAFASVGIVSNVIAIAANGGYMPASPRALELAGIAVSAEPHNNSAVAEQSARLLVLGDVMAVPEWVPLVANVFSVGDVLIAGGVALMLATAMRAPDRAGRIDATEAQAQVAP
jgi:hypothetical protein